MNKLIFISNSLPDIKATKAFAKKYRYLMEHYSKEEWKKKEKGFLFSKKHKKQHLYVLPSADTSSPLLSPTTIHEAKQTCIQQALLLQRGNVYRAAKDLGLSRATLYRKIHELNIDLEFIRFSAEEKEYQVTPLNKAS